MYLISMTLVKSEMQRKRYQPNFITSHRDHSGRIVLRQLENIDRLKLNCI